MCEPATAKPWKRLRALALLHERGIRTAVFLSPILPGLTDDVEHLEAVVAAAAEARVDFVWGGMLRLGPGVREYYLSFLQREHPELLPRYVELYHRVNAPAAYRHMVMARVDSLRRRYVLARDRRPDRQQGEVAPLHIPSLAPALCWVSI